MNGEEGETVQIQSMEGQPGVVEEAEADNILAIHIERMNEYSYLGYIGPEMFHFRTAAPQGPWIHLVA